MKSNLVQRTVTGVLFVAVLVGAILWNPISFGVLFALITALSVREFGHLMNQSGQVEINRNIASLAGAYLFLALMAFCTQVTSARVFLPYLLLLLYLMITAWPAGHRQSHRLGGRPARRQRGADLRHR